MYARGTQCISGGNPKWQMSVEASGPRIVVGQLLPSVMVVDKSLVCWSFVWPAEGIEISSLFVAAASCGPAGSPRWKPCEIRIQLEILGLEQLPPVIFLLRSSRLLSRLGKVTVEPLPPVLSSTIGLSDHSQNFAAVIFACCRSSEPTITRGLTRAAVVNREKATGGLEDVRVQPYM